MKIKDNIRHPQFPDFGGKEIKIEGKWEEINGNNWKKSVEIGVPAAIIYYLRVLEFNIPDDDNVYYGHTDDGLGHLVHESELEEIDND